ncbi:MAG: hypothetical protein M1831_004283 [Alyxoria varia]|nr:MAG: hypothetical protein M1831_004283 [Alyxoria varia]
MTSRTKLYTRTPNDFINHIVDWAADKPLLQIYSQKGGWEGWAQVELAMAFPQWLGGSADREVDVYTNGALADILTTAVDNKMMIFELKCQSFYQDQVTPDALANGFILDLNKVNYTPRKQDYQNAARIVIGIGVTGTGVDRAIEIFTGPAFAYPNQTFWTQAPNNGPTVFYAEFS